MKYRTIVADPPWSYDSARITTTGKQRRAEAIAHYPTMTLDEICALDVATLAENDAHLYLWVTCPLIFHGERVMKAWGFEYKSFLTWEKLGALGMGFHWRNQTEHVLFGVRGSLPIPPEKRKRNIFQGPKTRHSAKPDVFYDLVEMVSPGPYLEMFSRRARFGWDVWGNEVDSHVDLDAA